MGLKLWEDLLLGRLVPSVSSTVTALVIVFVFMWLFRVRNPGTRYILLHLPLIKGLLVLIRGVPAPLPGFEAGLRFGFQVFDPLSMVRIPDVAVDDFPAKLQPIDVGPEWDAGLVQAAFFVAIGAALGILAYRWIGLTLFYRRLLLEPTAPRDQAAAVYAVLDRIVPAFGVTYPRLVVVEDLAMTPCTIGLRPATVVLPARLLRELSRDQLEAVLAHELAHVSRHDGFFHWPSLLLRDLQAFNPLAHRLFARLLVEREIDADLRAARATGQPKSLARALVDVALLARGANLIPVPGAMSFSQRLLSGVDVLEQRVSALLANATTSSRLRPLGLGLLVLYVVLVRIYVQFPLLGHVIMLE